MPIAIICNDAAVTGHPWTEEEHAAFLEGLQRFGKGSWLAISRHCVKTRNPTQIASHAQKYFLRLSQGVARSSRFTAIEQVRDASSHDCSSQPGCQICCTPHPCCSTLLSAASLASISVRCA